LPPHTCNAAAAVAADAAAAVAAAAAEAAEAAALSLKAVDVVAFNKAAETRFVEITKKLVPCPVSHLVRETAYTLDVSVETANATYSSTLPAMPSLQSFVAS
jgi:prephenate dehydratase